MKVLVVDDVKIFRENVRDYLLSRGFDVVGEAGNGLEATIKTVLLKPDVVLMDLDMPLVDGVKAIAELKGQKSAVKIIVITAIREMDYFYNLKDTVDGYLMKLSLSLETIEEAINRVFRGEKFYLKSGLTNDDMGLRVHKNALTEQEMRVKKLVCEGLTNREIADMLFISERTVKFHLSNIYLKLNVADRKELIKIHYGKKLIV